MKKLKANIGMQDKLIRLILALVILLLVWFDVIKGTGMQIAALTLALILAVTSYLDYCPLYALLGISTAKDDGTDSTKTEENT